MCLEYYINIHNDVVFYRKHKNAFIRKKKKRKKLTIKYSAFVDIVPLREFHIQFQHSNLLNKIAKMYLFIYAIFNLSMLHASMKTQKKTTFLITIIVLLFSFSA